jgi:hypothetical protein
MDMDPVDVTDVMRDTTESALDDRLRFLPDPDSEPSPEPVSDASGGDPCASAGDSALTANFASGGSAAARIPLPSCHLSMWAIPGGGIFMSSVP